MIDPSRKIIVKHSIYVYTHTHTHTYTHTHIYTHTPIHILTYTYLYIFSYLCIYTSWFVLYVAIYLSFFLLFRASPTAYGSFWVRDQTRTPTVTLAAAVRFLTHYAMVGTSFSFYFTFFFFFLNPCSPVVGVLAVILRLSGMLIGKKSWAGFWDFVLTVQISSLAFQG